MLDSDHVAFELKIVGVETYAESTTNTVSYEGPLLSMDSSVQGISVGGQSLVMSGTKSNSTASPLKPIGEVPQLRKKVHTLVLEMFAPLGYPGKKLHFSLKMCQNI